MDTKLTLTLQKEVIEQAKKYAKDKGQSLSDLVENYLKLITVPTEKGKPGRVSPKIKKMQGIVRIPLDKDYKQILAEELAKKYGA